MEWFRFTLFGSTQAYGSLKANGKITVSSRQCYIVIEVFQFTVLSQQVKMTQFVLLLLRITKDDDIINHTKSVFPLVTVAICCPLMFH